MSSKSLSFSKTDWKESDIVVGNSSNKFQFHVTKKQVDNDHARGLTQGFGSGSNANYCVINVFEEKVELVGFVINGSSVACNIRAYSKK